jgi:outer membrane lipoprotein-sorting protein
VFDMLFKLVMTVCLVGTLIAFFVSVGESNKQMEHLADKLNTISIRLGSTSYETSRG